MITCDKCGACKPSPRVAKAAKPMDKKEFYLAAKEVTRLVDEVFILAGHEKLTESEKEKFQHLRHMASAVLRDAERALFSEQPGIEKQILREEIIRDPSRLDKMSYADIAALEM